MKKTLFFWPFFRFFEKVRNFLRNGPKNWPRPNTLKRSQTHKINVLEYLLSNDINRKFLWFLCVELETSQKNFPKSSKSDFLPFLAWFWPIFRKTKKSNPRRSILDFFSNFFSARKPYISYLQSFLVIFGQKKIFQKKSKKRPK